MPIAFRIIPDLQVVEVRLQGWITASDLLEYRTALRSHPDHQPEFNALIVLAEDAELPSGHILRNFARALAQDLSGSASKRALVAPQLHHFGMMRMVQILAAETPLQYEVFRTEVEAREWLGLPASSPDEEADEQVTGPDDG